MAIATPLPNSIIGGISLKTIIIVVVVIIVLYTGTRFISSSLSSSSSAGTISNKIICQLGEVVVNGACVNPGPCGLKPSTSECDPSLLICDLDIGNKWRCPLPCENSTHVLPNGLGKCTKSEIKCDSLGEYYCPNDATFCSSSGSYYSNGTTGRCLCNTGYIGDKCEIKCPENYFVHQNQCMPILTCNNGGTFNMTNNICSCTPDYTGKTCDYTSVITCSGNGTVVLDASQSFDHCNCNAGYLGPHCNVSAAYCNNKGTPLFDANGNVTGCACDTGYGGKYCDLNGSDYCHGHGTPLSSGVDKNNQSIFDDIHGCINCDSSSSGKYCCPNPSPTNTDTCGIKGYVCNSYSSQNDGWTPDYYTGTDFSNNQDFKNGTGPCVSKYCGNVDTTKYKVILQDKGTGSAGQIITCSTQCPYTLTNDMCPGGGTSSTGIYDGSNCKVSYEKGDTYSHQCICDQATDYKPSCQPVQTDGNKKCGPVPIGLCGQGGPTPECLQCPNGGFMWYCPGEVPAKGTTLANNLVGCVRMGRDITYNNEGNFWQVNGDPNNVPIYPAINNDTCESLSGSLATDFMSYPTQDLYNIFGNTPSNYTVGSDGKFTKIAERKGLHGAEGLSGSQMFTNSYLETNGTIGYFPSLSNAYNRQVVQNPGCIVNIPSGNPDVAYCNGHGTFKQTCYQSDGKTVVDCSSSSAVYRLHDGTCTCDMGYAGNQCQYSDINTCSGNGAVSSAQTRKSIHLSDTPLCSCKTGYDNSRGGKCEYFIDWLKGSWTSNSVTYASGVTRNGKEFTFTFISTPDISLSDPEMTILSRKTIDGTINIPISDLVVYGVIEHYYVIVSNTVVLLIAKNKKVPDTDGMNYGIIIKNMDGTLTYYGQWQPSMVPNNTMIPVDRYKPQSLHNIFSAFSVNNLTSVKSAYSSYFTNIPSPTMPPTMAPAKSPTNISWMTLLLIVFILSIGCLALYKIFRY